MSDSESSSSGSTMPPTPLEQDIEDMTVPTLRGSIASEAGKRTDWGTPLDKETLNTVHAYLTGEYVTPKVALYNPNHPDFVPARKVFLAVAKVSGVVDPEDGWIGGDSGSNVVPDSFRREELLHIRQKMRAVESQLFYEQEDGGDGE